MKKKLLALLLLSGMYARVFAQSYSVQPIPFIPFPFNTGTVVTLSDDQYSQPIPIGFDFCFFGQSYDTILISPNSYITFDTSLAGEYSPWNITGPFPDSSLPKNVIMFPWQDLLPPNGGEIRYDLYGIAPCRKFVVSYDSVPMYSCTNFYFSNQLVLYESSNVIETYIENKPLCPTWNSGQAVHGLQNADGTEAVIIPGRNSGFQWEGYSDGMRFTPLSCLTDTNSCALLSDTSFTLISGKLYVDSNDNCIHDGLETGLSNKLITLTPGNLSAYTNINGDYHIFVFDTGLYEFHYNIPPDMQFPQCGQNQVHVAALDDTIAVDLAMETLECSSIRGYFSMPDFTACDTIEFDVIVTNEGTVLSGNTTLEISYSYQFIVLNCNYNYSISLNQDTLIIYMPNGLIPDQDYVVSVQAIMNCSLQGGGTICIDGRSIHGTPVCSDISEYISIGCSSELISIETYSSKKFTIYPNPSKNQFTISGTTTSDDHLQLIDITGRILRTYTLNESSTTLNIDGVAAGFYTFSIINSKNAVIGNGKIQVVD